MIKKQAFSIAEVLTAMTIVALIMAATAPILIKSKTVPQEAPWKYVSLGELSQNAAVYGATDNIAVAVFGDKRIPLDRNVASTLQKGVFQTKINPKISVVARNRAFNPLISRHLIDFYEKDASDEDNYDNIGKISFDAYYNLAVGKNALDSIKTPQSVEFSGSDNLWTSTSGTPKGALNTAVGQYAMGGDKKNLSATAPERNMEGAANTAVGAFAMRRNTTGNQNTAAGAYALESATDALPGKGIDNVAVGYTALRKNSMGSYNIAVGSRSMALNTTGNSNTAVGYQSLYSNTMGNSNTAVGSQALMANTTGGQNTAFGSEALMTSTTVSENTAVGYQALAENTTGQYNTAVGYQALKANTTGQYNTAVGSDALKNATGSNNTAIGSGALMAKTTGDRNTAIGYNALDANTTGSNNTAVGYNAGSGNNTGSNRLYISAHNERTGQNALIYGEDDTERILVFNVDAAYIIVGDETPNDNTNKIVTEERLKTYGIQKASLDVSELWRIAYSDIRLKNVIGDSTAGLNEILQIKVKNFTMKNDKRKEPKVGVIAQDLQKVFPKSVFKGADGYLRIKRDEIFYACVNAIKELHAIIQDVVTKIAALDEKVTETEKQNQLIAKKLSAIKEQNKLLEAELSALEN